jgi:hypothetical protein
VEQFKTLSKVISRGELARIQQGILAAVVRSAHLRPQISYTEAMISHDEFKRRVKWCIDKALEWKAKHNWVADRICDELKTAVVNWLDGNEQPDSTHNIWVDPDEVEAAKKAGLI